MLLKESIGKRLLVLRGYKSQREVAQAVGLTVGAIGMYENGKRIPKDDIKIKLANYYGVTVQELFFSEQE